MNLQTIIVGIALLGAFGFWLTIKVSNAIEQAELMGNEREDLKDLAADSMAREQWGQKAAVTIVRKTPTQMELLRKKVRP